MSVTSLFVPKSAGLNLDLGEDAFGSLESSANIIDDQKLLRERLSEEGYLYLPRFLDPDAVLRARDSITKRLATEGLLHSDYPPFEGVARPGQRTVFRPDLAFGNHEIESLIYGTRVIGFYRVLLGGPIRHYDFTWFRPVGPGNGTPPHCDLVYMGRGTHQVFTLWVPYGNVTFDLGGLMILEGSHKKSSLLRHYLQRDVDRYCSNRPGAEEAKAMERSLWNGWLAKNPVALREKLGGRWLTTEFKVGDVVTFGMTVVHASLDNQTDRIRFSSDSRYQLASEAIDDRWIGPKPAGHSSAGKRGKIC
ncbi:MAG TPA: phytanoyl-CoA dioxygenase family protein [Chthoniobacterales bacterium]|jgi:ectoine hydroxylase-related dioxygenase (phytanoyl-CoA dioxygenase family)|nr:phytanoyl-CoA dioxygenase family protein [Chthoniobacterales bacterium]